MPRVAGAFAPNRVGRRQRRLLLEFAHRSGRRPRLWRRAQPDPGPLWVMFQGCCGVAAAQHQKGMCDTLNFHRWAAEVCWRREKLIKSAE